MAKKEDSKEVAVAQPTSVAEVKPELSLADQLAALGASPSLVKRAVKAAANFALMEQPKIPRIKANTNGLMLDEDDEAPVKELSGVIIWGGKTKSFYKKSWVKGSKELPDCYSLDAKVPEADVKERQHPVCKGCPQNEFETARQGKGKACRDIRRLFLLENVEAGTESIMPRLLSVTPASIKNWDTYMGRLVAHGASYDEVITKINATKADPADPHVVLSFSRLKSLGEDSPEEKQQLANIAALKTLWLPYMEQQVVSAEDTEASADGPRGENGEILF